MPSKKTRRLRRPEELRSHRWFAPQDLRSFGHRSRMAQLGLGRDDYVGKPVIAIVNTWSDLNPCHSHLRARAEDVKRGVWQAGGFPVELPVMSLAENFQKPTTMLYRNLLAMETEEILRSYPVDGCVLLGGCDKTTPGLVMGAISMDLPTVFMAAGPMVRGNFRGQVLGSGSDVWKYWDELRAGRITDADWQEMEQGIARSPGTCMTMGTASTMCALVETLGLSLPGSSSIPAIDAEHTRMSALTGRRAVELVWEDLRPSRLLRADAFANATTALMALGGSTNAVIHLIAMAGRARLQYGLDDIDRASRKTPVLCNLRPSGQYLMEDYHFAGGLPGLLSRLRHSLNMEAHTVTGVSLGENIAGARVHNDDVIRPLDRPVFASGGLAILRGNLAPDGAVIKASAADPVKLTHRGPALVFEDYNDLVARLHAPDLPVSGDSVLVLKNAGPQGGPGMPEWGMLPLPKKLLDQGVRDVVRLSDARMSGTSYGTCVLHVAPESFIGGPLAFVCTGDVIELDVPRRRLHLDVADEELARRRAAWTPPPPRFTRGYGLMFSRHILQADRGCDFDFLLQEGENPEPEIH